MTCRVPAHYLWICQLFERCALVDASAFFHPVLPSTGTSTRSMCVCVCAAWRKLLKFHFRLILTAPLATTYVHRRSPFYWWKTNVERECFFANAVGVFVVSWLSQLNSGSERKSTNSSVWPVVVNDVLSFCKVHLVTRAQSVVMSCGHNWSEVVWRRTPEEAKAERVD